MTSLRDPQLIEESDVVMPRTEATLVPSPFECTGASILRNRVAVIFSRREADGRREKKLERFASYFADAGTPSRHPAQRTTGPELVWSVLLSVMSDMTRRPAMRVQDVMTDRVSKLSLFLSMRRHTGSHRCYHRV
jgi:hypothetical protein